MDFLEAAQKIISIESTPTQGTVEVVYFLKKLAEGMGFTVKVVEEVSGGVSQANIVITPNARPQALMLQNHLDTIDPGSFALWTKTGFNPFQASIRGGHIYGLGSADVKLDFLCKLFAMKKTDWNPLKSSVALLGTFGEEQHMRGAIKAVRERLVKPTLALIGEPTDLNIVYASKGIARIEIIIPYKGRVIDEWGEDEVTGSSQSKIFQGRAAHSSNPELGENAVVKMLEYLLQLPKTISLLNIDGGLSFNTIPTQAALEFDLDTNKVDDRPQKIRAIYEKVKQLEGEFKKFPDAAFEPPNPTINIGMIRTNEDHILITGAVRWSSHISETQYTQWMAELGAVCKKQNAVFRVLDVKKPFHTSKSDFAQLCLKEIQTTFPAATLKTVPVTNEANVFSKLGFECLVFGPGHRQNNSHTPEEHVSLADLQIAEDFYCRVIQRICS
ncbi:MAG: M20/M25/M40 family metallo-hydrolase [Bdellovibrionales bacterium]|nr:M20/M25/M40 family metallo-hydrolase [Bdellovibrionales bacterium]